MYENEGITRETLAGKICRLHPSASPVCWILHHTITDETLNRLAQLGSAFLIDWRACSSETTTLLLTKIHHDYPHHLIFIDAREMLVEDWHDVIAVLQRAEVHGGIVPFLSDRFVENAVTTRRFIFVFLDATTPPKALAGEVRGLLAKTLSNRHGRPNVGGAVGTQHAPLFSALERYADVFPLLVVCTARDWKDLPRAIQGVVTVAPGMRLIALPAQTNDNAWENACVEAARQLAGTLQSAITARAAIQ